MKIVVFGTGFVGSAIARELARRGHEVTAVSRSGAAELPVGIAARTGSVHDEQFLAEVASGADVLISALPSRADDAGLAAGVTALAQAAEHAGARLGVVGGASIIPVVDGQPPQGDTPGFPAQFAPLHHAHQAAYAALEAAPAGVDWFYFIPAGEFGPHNPGTRTGAYRTSTSSQVVGADGHSTIGVEDYAIAFADEVETPVTHRGWITVGY